MSAAYGFNAQQPVLVYGLGGSGRAAVAALSEAGIPVWAWDDGEAALPAEVAAQANVQRKSPLPEEWQQIQAVIKAPGIAFTTPLIQAALGANVPVLGESDLLWRREKNSGAFWIGITGTNGKSTTTALVGHILREAGKKVAVGGNLGIPALQLPDVGEGGFYVLELSSYQLEMMREMAVDGAIFLNLTPDHLERHGTMEAYAEAKTKLFTLAKPEATRVLGTDQLPLIALAAKGGVTTIATQGQKADYSVQEGAIYQGKTKLLELAEIPTLPGPHNAQNIMAALALLVPRWLTLEQFLAGAKTFKGLPHRLEKVGNLGGIRFINDSKATNGDSTVYALQSFKHIYWICGGKPKTDGLGGCLNHLNSVRAAFTIGEAGPAFAQAISAKGTPAFECKTMERAVEEAYASAKTEALEGAVVLLSPAAASYDQFRNFEHRGDVFANCVRQLADYQAPAKVSK
jgi:UDP-N-acetylmuramoylalanine--D-glutamate ligase